MSPSSFQIHKNYEVVTINTSIFQMRRHSLGQVKPPALDTQLISYRPRFKNWAAIGTQTLATSYSAPFA